MKPKGWRNESSRHSMASRGIKSAQKIRVPRFTSPKLSKKGIEVVVWQDKNKGSSWDSEPMTRYFLLKDGKQIDGFDVSGAKFKESELNDLLKRNNITKPNVKVFIK